MKFGASIYILIKSASKWIDERVAHADSENLINSVRICGKVVERNGAQAESERVLACDVEKPFSTSTIGWKVLPSVNNFLSRSLRNLFLDLFMLIARPINIESGKHKNSYPTSFTFLQASAGKKVTN